MTTNPIIIPKNARQLFIDAPCGKLDILELMPKASPCGVAIIIHPDPKGGGTYTNKIVQSIAKVMNAKGYICYCPNLRGVGMSEGEHDFGIGEIEDAKALHEYIRQSYSDLPLFIAGFSFGCAVASGLAAQVEHQKLVLIGPAVTRYNVVVPDKNKTLVISETKENKFKSISEGVEYVHLFPKNLKILIKKYGLNTNELLVLTEIMESMLSHGNLLINFSQKALCELTGINKSTMCKTFKTLKQKQCLIEKNGHIYLNSVIFMKGLPHKLFMQFRDHFLNSISYKLDDEEEFEKVFDDNFIKAYEKNLKEIKKKKQQIKEKKISKALDNFEKEISKEWKEKFKDEEENFEFGFESEM